MTQPWGNWMSRPKGPSYDQYFADQPSGAKPDENAFEAITRISETIEALRNPDGTQKAPARTCRDLALANPDFENGYYYIDPNQGSPVDAIEVYCDIKKQETCIIPSPNTIEKKTWYVGESGHMWFGEDIEEGFPFTYKADAVQLTFLQLLSKQAKQTITYHCKNSVAFFEKSSGSYDKALRFMAANDLELVANKPRKFRYDVTEDGCMYGGEKWSKTVFDFTTEKTRRLPIMDVAPSDIGAESQQFGLEIGAACFS